jgi:hypothetical protein
VGFAKLQVTVMVSGSEKLNTSKVRVAMPAPFMATVPMRAGELIVTVPVLTIS